MLSRHAKSKLTDLSGLGIPYRPLSPAEIEHYGEWLNEAEERAVINHLYIMESKGILYCNSGVMDLVCCLLEYRGEPPPEFTVLDYLLWRPDVEQVIEEDAPFPDGIGFTTRRPLLRGKAVPRPRGAPNPQKILASLQAMLDRQEKLDLSRPSALYHYLLLQETVGRINYVLQKVRDGEYESDSMEAVFELRKNKRPAPEDESSSESDSEGEEGTPEGTPEAAPVADAKATSKATAEATPKAAKATAKATKATPKATKATPKATKTTTKATAKTTAKTSTASESAPKSAPPKKQKRS